LASPLIAFTVKIARGVFGNRLLDFSVIGLLSRATMRAAEPDLVASSNERNPKRHDIEDRNVAGRGCVGVRAEREKTAQIARDQVVAEFNGSADRLAGEVLRLRGGDGPHCASGDDGARGQGIFVPAGEASRASGAAVKRSPRCADRPRKILALRG